MIEDNLLETEFDAVDDSLNSVNAFLTAEFEKAGVPAKAVMQLSVAVEEIFINIAHYGYPKDRGKAKVGIGIKDNVVTIKFVDGGVPFDPLSKELPDVTLSANERKIGGLGIYLVRKTMDSVEYEYKDGKNVLQIQKKF